MVIIRALVLATRAMACKAQAIRAMACMEATRAMACKATQITAYMEESAAIRDMERTEDPAVTQAAAMEALRELEAIRACTMKMMDITTIITIIMMEKIIFITIIMMVIMATITTIWATGEKTVINKEDDGIKRTLLQIKSVFLAFFLTVQSGNW